jgi:diacylglycerol kinase (ATP)
MSVTPHHTQKSKPGLKRIVNAGKYSYFGFKHAWQNEQAFRQELLMVIPGIIVACCLPISPLKKLALVAVLILVLIIELLNSAVEAAIDRISLDMHPLSKAAKDLGSAAVFLTLLLALVTWIVILWPLFFTV